MNKIKVLAVCANVLFRRGLVQTLQNSSSIEVVDDTENGDQALRLLQELQPDVVLVGSVIERLTSIELTRRIKEIQPATLVLACSSAVDIKQTLSLLQAGADGYLLENTKPEAMIAAISTVRAGESIIDPLILRALLRQVPEFSEELKVAQRSPLSNKELQVIRLAAQGMRNKEIARELNMSVSTVKAHWANIFTKMGINSRTQAVFCAIREGYLSPEEIT